MSRATSTLQAAISTSASPAAVPPPSFSPAAVDVSPPPFAEGEEEEQVIREVRVRKLIDDGIAVEDKEVGRGARAVLLVRTSGDYNHNKIIDKITEMKDVCNLFLTMGNYDIILTACTTDEAELYQMINNLRTLDGVLWVDFASIVSRRKVLSKILPIPNDSVSV